MPTQYLHLKNEKRLRLYAGEWGVKYLIPDGCWRGGGGGSLKVANWFWLALLQENLNHLGRFCWSIIFSYYKVKWQMSSGPLAKISSMNLVRSLHPRKSSPECSNLDRGNNPTLNIDAAGKLCFLSSWKFTIHESFEILMFYSIFSLTK